MSEDLITYEEHGKVAVLTMDDGKANSVSAAMIEALDAAFERARTEARAVVLAGRPGKFSAGFDLRVMMSGPAAVRGLVVAGGEMLMRLYEHPQPVVIACTGHALAAGVLLVAIGDTRIGISGDFKIGLPEVKNSMPVPIFAHELARDRLDPRELTAAVLHARVYDPDGACRAGWLDRVVAPEELEEQALAEAKRLARFSPQAYAMTKRSFRQATITHVRDTIRANLDMLTGGG